MRTARRWVGLLLTLALTLAAAACTRPSDPEEAVRVLNIGDNLEPDGLDMITVTGAGTPQILLYNVYETLVKLDSEGDIEPLLAKSWTRSDDRLIYTFSLDPKAKFASGAPVSADAVVASFERARSDVATGQSRNAWAPVTTIEAKDTKTVVVTLSRPSNQWFYDLTGPAGTISDPAFTGDFNAASAGSGPYAFSKWEQGSLVQLVANRAYWGTPPRFDEVNFRYFADPNAMNAALLAGQLDLITNLAPPQALDQFSDSSRFSVHEGITNGEVVLGFNHKNEALSKLEVRQAINYAIDRKALVKAAWGGKGELIGSMDVPTDPWYEDLSGTYPFDQDKARQLLKDAGYADGLTLRLRVPSLPYGPAVGRFLTAQLKEVGITVEVETLEFVRWLDLVYTKRDYDLTLVAHVEPRDIGNFALDDYYWNYHNPEFQRLIAEGDAGTDEEQVTAYKKAARLLAEDAAADWLFLLPNITVASSKISGVQDNQVSLSFDLSTLASRG
ncbi:MAG: ABC transporter substrate-binding protein [Arachnia sp.]